MHAIKFAWIIKLRLIRCMDNNDLSSFLNILNKHQSNLDIEYEDKETGHTLLTYACSYGLFDFIKILIENKDADVNHCNYRTNDSPLHYASLVPNMFIFLKRYMIVDSWNNENKKKYFLHNYSKFK